jgi:porin
MLKIARGLAGAAVSCLALWLIVGPSISRSRAEPPPGDSGFLNDLWTRDTLLGNTGGFRSRLGSVGLSVGLQDTNEVFGNTAGGPHTGAAYSGLTMLSLGVDTKVARGWEGGIFNASLINIRGRGLSGDNLLALQTVSGIVARPTTRLWELWFRQSFGGRFDIKLGQQSLDMGFMTSQ